ncbi:zinc ribbon domain-containing protein [Bradyrhizobium sp. BR 1433]|uniref:zinc ribbon domain-containing protein n=1 Tax=Bradyrhizobium sp. BR 1433 TaxID=3447967 RepID=UPI003EE52B6E
MQCERCGHANRAGNDYCEDCGAPLGIKCDSCQHVNGPSSRFCGRCGTALAAGSVVPTRPRSGCCVRSAPRAANARTSPCCLPISATRPI